MLTRTRPRPGVILPIEAAPPIFSEGTDPDVLFRLGPFGVPVVAAPDRKGFDVAPIVLQLVEELPVDEWGRLEAGFDIERHLAGRSFQVLLDDGSGAVLDGVASPA